MQKAEMVIEQCTPLLRYLEKALGIKTEIVYTPDYDEMILRFVQGEIDIAYLGPLPYVKLHNRFPDAQPLVRFLDKDGQESYTCSLVARKTNREDNVSTILKQAKHISLTQPSSTCGYLMTEKMLKRHGLSLQKDKLYNYTGSHTNSILSVILGDTDVGGVKTSIAEKYLFHGLKIIETSETIPGFALVYNRQTLSKEMANKLKLALLKLHPLESPEDAAITSSWGEQMKYGTKELTHADYESVIKASDTITIPERE